MKVFSRLCGLKVAMLWGVTVAVATLLIAHPAAAQSAGGYCFAKIDGSTGAVLTSGGFCVVTGTRTSPGTYTVSFFGSFPPAITPGNVVVNTTAESAIFGVSNAVAGPVVNPGQIDVTAFTWSSPTATTVDNTFFVSLFVGQ